MPNTTPNYNLTKPLATEFYDVEVQNGNMDKIDAKLKALDDDVANIEVPVTSVNNKTGAVQLTASDVGAETPTGAQTKVNALAGAGNTKTVKQLDDALALHSAEQATENQRLASEDNRLHQLNANLQKEVAYLKLQQEAADRIENGTTFADDFLGNRFGMTFNTAESAGVTIKDGALTLNNLTEQLNTVTDATIANSAYDTSGNGGRKLVRLSNGWLVAGVKDTANRLYKLYKSVDNGQTFTHLRDLGYNVDGGTGSSADLAICSAGTKIIMIYNFLNGSSPYVRCMVIDSETGDHLDFTTISNGVTVLGGISLAINEAGTEAHAAWSCKNSTYPNSFNIQYNKGTINADGSVTWGAVEQISETNASGQDNKNPCIISVNGNPVIFYDSTHNGNKAIYCESYNGSAWSIKSVYSGGSTYTQSSPSAIFVPQSINGLPQGRIWVAWQGVDSSSSSRSNIMVSYSDDGGATWSTMEKLTNETTEYQYVPSITANKNNKIFIVFYGKDPQHASAYVRNRLVENDGTGWVNRTYDTPTNAHAYNPSTLFDDKFSLDFSEPLFIYKNTTNAKVCFYGTWEEVNETPTLTGTAVYDLPSTDYVGAFVQKAGAVNVDAYINEVLMDDDLVGNEHQFTQSLASAAPVKLRLELSRASTAGGDDDKVTRILGGLA